MKKHCYICYSDNIEEEMICDTCGRYYCEDCSYTFTLHYQFQGAKCYMCAEQGRISKLNDAEVRNNKLKLIEIIIEWSI